MAELNVPRFYARLGKLHAHFVRHRTAWGGATCLSLHRGPLNDDDTQPYLKSIVLHQYLFGYELPDTILVLTEAGMCHILTTRKKCEFLEKAVGHAPPEGSILGVTLLQRSKGAGEDVHKENFAKLMKEADIHAAAPNNVKKEENGDSETKSEEDKDKNGTTNGNTKKVGLILKEASIKDAKNPPPASAKPTNTTNKDVVKAWEIAMATTTTVEFVDVSGGISLVMGVKEDAELDLLKKSSVLSNKVLKHGVIPKLEDIIDNETTVTHEALATEVEGIIEDPDKIKLKVPKDHVESCYFPIVQSGGTYDIRVSAQSTEETLKYDIILVSFGARYQMYCSNISRTFLVDPPKLVSDTYETLLNTHAACLEAMVPGKPLKAVYHAAVHYLKRTKNTHLVKCLPKNLGFSIGLDFRDSALTLSAKNPAQMRAGMVFNLSVGFAGVGLEERDKKSVHSKSPVKALTKFAVLISDMVEITSKKAEIMTKHAKALTDISYTINDEEDEDADAASSSAASNSKKSTPEAPEGDEAYARKLAKSADNVNNGSKNGQRVSARLASSASTQEMADGAAERERRQIKLMARRNEERLRELARADARNKGKQDETETADELLTYKKSKDYPDNVLPNQVKVDMANECVILPMCGIPVPFHISTIKNVVLPDPDTATYLRINFYTAGVAISKDTPQNTAKLIQKHAPYATFIRELTFRSLASNNLTQAFRQISELRKRVRQRELQEQEEANLVKQEQLVRTKNERVPRLSDLTMRPVFSGRKTQGNLESHTNGLRFISMRGETLDIMYNNVKHAIFQPCENEIMVLVHFHLKNPIMVGKKRQRDIQFFTEVIDASLQVDAGRRSMYDPDEMDDEQRERQLRRKLNQAFKDFCRKVENTAKKNGYSLEFDIPYRDLGFMGTPYKEMVFIQPTLNCLVNVTDTPFFVVDLSEVDHVHFERITFMSKAFDIVLINKDFSKQPWRVDMVPNADKDSVQDWLTDMEISYTEGPMNLNWKQIMLTVASDDRFYMKTEEDGITEKEAGWEFLRMFGKDGSDEEESEDEDPDFAAEPSDDGANSDESSSEESDFDSESSEESDYDADDDLEEQGMDWDDMERKAAADDRRRSRGVDEGSDSERRRKKAKAAPPSRRRGSAGAMRGGRSPPGGRNAAAMRRRGGPAPPPKRRRR